MNSRAEDNSFKTYRQEPSNQQNLLSLLTAYQDRIYNTCFQILRRHDEAQDVAQDVLINLTQHLHKFRDPLHLRRWLHRTGLNASLTAIRSRKRRDHHETRSAMMHQNIDSPDSDLPHALLQSMTILDEQTQYLLNEHFFQRRSLDELARENDCSKVSIWKRIAKGKQKLRVALSGAAFAVMASNLDAHLGAVIPVVAPPSLVTPELLSKAWSAATPTSTSLGRTLLSGGIEMTRTGLLTGISAVLLVGGISGYMIGQSNLSIPQTERTVIRHEPVVQVPVAPTHKTLARSEKDPTPAGVAPPPSKSQTPNFRLLDLLKDRLTDKQIGAALWHLAIRDENVRREVFAVLCATRDPEIIRASQDLLIALKDEGLLTQVVDLFKSEKTPERKQALAYVVGARWTQRSVRPLFLDLLDQQDPALLEPLLSRMCVQQMDHEVGGQEKDELYIRVTTRLRQLVQGGASETVRAKAADALRGASRPREIQFLIHTMLTDVSSEVQEASFDALPCNYMSPSSLIQNQIDAMVQVALDESRTMRLRRLCAERVLMETGSAIGNEGTIDPSQKQYLKSLIEKIKQQSE